jgi:septal ring factor EnvC (AmiA/AmiB activator)
MFLACSEILNDFQAHSRNSLSKDESGRFVCFFHVFVFLKTSLCFFEVLLLRRFVFAVFEENTRKLSSSKLASFQKTYDLKASIVGKVISERLLENDETINKLSGDSEKLKRDLDKAQSSSIELEQRISELIDSLNKCRMKRKVPKLPFKIRRKSYRS